MTTRVNKENLTETTAILCAAANLKARKIYDYIHPRKANQFKSSTKEHGIDIEVIFAESSKAMRRVLYRDVAIGIAAFFTVIVLVNELQGGQAPDLLGSIILPILILGFAVIAMFDFIHTRITKKRAREILSAIADANQNVPIQEVADSVTVSGGFSPFVGAGYDISGWTFIVDLEKPDDESNVVVPVTADELYEESTQRLLRTGLKNVTISDEIFVDGRDVRAYSEIMTGGDFARPASDLAQSVAEGLIKQSGHHFRKYNVIRIVLWNGQLVLSFFHRYVITGSNLYVETRIFLLPPLKHELNEIDNMPSITSFSEFRNDFVTSLLKAPFLWLIVLFRFTIFMLSGIWSSIFNSKARAIRKEIKHNRRYNYGWPNSLREAWASDSFERYFQLVDQDYAVKHVKEALLKSLKESLEKRNISTDEFGDAVTKIFNEGVIVNGGQVKAENIAVGKGAKTLANNIFGGKSGQKTGSKSVQES